MTLGVPFPEGMVSDPQGLSVGKAGESAPIPLQIHPLRHWPDGSCQWVLLDFLVSADPKETVEILLFHGASPGAPEPMRLEKEENCWIVDTGAARFEIPLDRFAPFRRVEIGDQSILGEGGGLCFLEGARDGEFFFPWIRKAEVECRGAVRTTVNLKGWFSSEEGKIPAAFEGRLHFYARQSICRVDFAMVNPRAAHHHGGLWDLGDPASFLFHDLSIHVPMPRSAGENSFQFRFRETASDGLQKLDGDAHSSFRIHQESSGGKNWRSPVHVNREGNIPLLFKGYRVFQNSEPMSEGGRANPFAGWESETGSAGVGVRHFWQNFPKSVSLDSKGITVGLFPRGHGDLHELQGGERKTHSVFFHFSKEKLPENALRWMESPLVPRLPPAWYEKTGVFPYFSASNADPDSFVAQVLQTAIEGENSLFQRRERIDEYGWRNFGELYADHESVNHTGETPFVSHYNNQYDCLYGMLFQFARTGRTEWFQLADEMAAHLRDIDMYHTDGDRPEYNHGPFWHTDHYLEARTATHRSFSRGNAASQEGAYGGGPSLSHLYASGFLCHYWMTGHPHSRDAVLDLGEFARKNLELENRLLLKGFRGLRRAKSMIANRMRGADLVQLGKVYELDGPGRASGNALTTFLDAFQLTGNFDYMKDAESVVYRCVHPEDDLEKRNLEDVENRWMYTVFLQALGKYLDTKRRLGKMDRHWEWARRSLLRYADWMAETECPYLLHPEKLEYPNETWAAQELRKTNVLLFAFRYSTNRDKGRRYFEKAMYFFREGMGLLSGFGERAFLTRPIALLLQNSEMVRGIMEIGDEKEKMLLPDSYRLDGGIGAKRKFREMVQCFSLAEEINMMKWRLFPDLIRR